MRILVDADACPRSVLKICLQMGQREHIEVCTVASFNHNIESEHHIIVGNADQEADLKIMNLLKKGDIVITQDWGLAAMAMGKGAQCLHPMGWAYSAGKIDFMLEEREIKASLRRSGGRTKGPRKRSREDDRRFQELLGRYIQSSQG